MQRIVSYILMFGIASARFERIVEQIVGDIPEVFLNDIQITAKDDAYTII